MSSPVVLVSHLGWSTGTPQSAVVVVPDGRAPRRAAVGDVDVPIGPVQEVARWSGGPYARLDLPDLPTGRHRVEVELADGTVVGADLRIGPDLLQRETLSDVLAYFKAMRSSGEIDRKDRAARLWGDTTGRTVDARGGWLDASGDTSKFLSHLTYTATMSPQQIPLCAWAMLAARDALAVRHPALVRSLSARLRDEALWGADFLMRFRAPQGYFYTGIFDALTKQLDERLVTAPLPECVRTDRYQAAFRQGGGLAIAALARASTQDDDGEFDRAAYRDAAEAGFAHLHQHNLDYLDDGTESVVDDYCALLAATELVAAGVDVQDAAHARASALIARWTWPAHGPGWFVADAAGRPFVHAVEAGLPMLALLRFATVLPDAAAASRAREVAVQAMLDLLARSTTVANPFGCPRQRDAFFFPHANETGYWWQGENATLASLAAAAIECAQWAERDRLLAFAADQLAWITGRNPFDASMLQGRGRNNVDYHSDFPNLLGGIVNGITAGWSDEEGIAFLPPDAPEGEEWRWAEQWIPHTAWFLLAVAALP